MRVCAYVTDNERCPALIDTGTYCDQHTKAKRQQSDKRRPNAKARGYGSRWQRTRSAYLDARPWCEADGCGELATDVHHLDGLGPTGPLGFEQANLQGLCHAHHSKLTARENPSGWAA